MVRKIAESLVMGLLIFAVGLFIITYYMNSFELQESQKENAVLNTMYLQRVCQIKKLVKRDKSYTAELTGLKKELGDSKDKLDSVTKELASLKTTLGNLSK
jgi:hypothetical protein